MFKYIPDKAKYRYIQVLYLLGTILDALCAADLAYYVISGFSIYYGYPNTPELRVAASSAFTLMLGWTFALAWGLKKPVERRALLLMIAIFIAIGRGFELILIANGFITLTPVYWAWFTWFIIFTFMLAIAYVMGKTTPVELQKSKK